MAALDSLLQTVADLGLASARTIEEAQARNVIFGGGQQACLLEVLPIQEADLLTAVGRCTGLPTMEAGPLRVVLPESGSLRALNLPLVVATGPDDELRVVSDGHVSDASLAQAKETLGTALAHFATSELRAAEAIAYVDGTPLEDRSSKLLDRWGPRLPDPNPTREDPTLAQTEVEPADPPTPPEHPMRPMLAKMTPFADTQLGAETGPPPGDYREITAAATSEAPPSREAQPYPSHVYSRLDAEQDLGAARTRDRVLDIVVHFVAARFRYVAAFGITRTEAKGLAARGPGAKSEVVRSLSIALDLPSCLREARDEGTPRVVRLRASGLEGGVARDLRRPAGIDILLLPIQVRERTVLLVWADNQGQSLPPEAVGEVVSFSLRVQEALEGVLLERKRKSRMMGSPAVSVRSAPPPPRAAHHEIAPTDPRTLGSPPSVPPQERPPAKEVSSSFPAEPPRTLKGFPSVDPPPLGRVPQGLTPLLGHGAFTGARAAQTLSRRIVPLSTRPSGAPSVQPPAEPSETESEADSNPESKRAAADRAEPEWSSESQGAPTGETMLSRRNPSIDAADAEAPGTAHSETDGFISAGKTKRSYSDLVDALLGGDDDALDLLLRGGETAVGALIARFPGPVVEPETPQTKASECGLILRALVALGSRATPFLTVRTADEDAEVRRWATFVLGELPGKESARAVASRLLDESPQVRRAALHAARRQQRDTLTRRTLRAFIEQGIRDASLPMQQRTLSIEALADIREHEAIPALLQLLEEPHAALARSARWALCVLTRQDFGSDVAAWRAFWQLHRDEDRVEWLINSLDHDERDIRRAAADELCSLAGDTFGFDEDQPPGERRDAQARFRTWWNEVGKGTV